MYGKLLLRGTEESMEIYWKEIAELIKNNTPEEEHEIKIKRKKINEERWNNQWGTEIWRRRNNSKDDKFDPKNNITLQNTGHMFTKIYWAMDNNIHRGNKMQHI